MKTSIRIRIFLPVVIILIAVPAATLLILRYSLAGSMNYNARREIESAIQTVDRSSPEIDYSELAESVRHEAAEVEMIVMNGSFRVLYPTNLSDRPEFTDIYALALTNLTDADSSWNSGGIFEDTVGDDSYLFYNDTVLFCGEEDDEELHIILYCPIQDTTYILSRVTGLLFIIMAGLAVVSIILVWIVAGSISGPVRRLCTAARQIGEKKFSHVETGTDVKELCELEEEINDMQDKLDEADKAEKTFFANASHELRTPLMSISGYAQGIQTGVFDDPAEAAGIIIEESSRLTEVVDGILTLTRMDQAQYDVIPVEVDIREFIEERFDSLNGLTYSGKIKLTLSDGEDFNIITDAQLLERAFTNVVSNCIRYAKSAVDISAEERDGYAYITVRDDGPGILEADMEHLFDRFYKGNKGNHGLGLAIAKSCLEYMGAAIEASSSPGGAEFVMKLPQDCRIFAMAEDK